MKLSKISINDDFEVFGYWALNKDLNGKVSGTLYKKDNKIRLKIYKEDWGESYNNIEFLYGFTEEGEMVTLKSLVCISHSFGSKITTVIYIIKEVLIGDYIDNSTKFKSISCSFNFLNKWINKKFDYLSDEKNKEINNYPKDYYYISNNLLMIDGLTFVEKMKNEKYEIILKKNLKLVFTPEIDLKECFFSFYKLQLFLNVFMNKYIVFDQIHMVIADENNIVIKRLYSQDSDKKFHDNSNVIYYENVTSLLDKILNKWYSNFSLFYTLTAELIKPNTFTYNVKAFHVELIRTFEIYHREFLENKEIEKIDVSKDLKKVLDFIDINVDNQSYFIDRVKFVEESVSFRTRLNQSFKTLPLKYQQELSDYVNKSFGYNRGINKNIKTLSNKLVDDRNNFIHNNIIQESKIYNLENNLFEEAKMLQKFLRYLILKELGFPEDLLLKDNYMYP